MDTIIVNGKSRKVVAYTELKYIDALRMFLDRKDNQKMFGWEIATQAGKGAMSVFNNGIDWGVVIKFQNFVRACKEYGKRPKMVKFAFTRDEVYIVNDSGAVIL